MQYCIEHESKAYTEEEFENVETRECAGTYQNSGDGMVRVYCDAGSSYRCGKKGNSANMSRMNYRRKTTWKIKLLKDWMG